MRFKSKKISAYLVTGALAVVITVAGAGASSAGATTWCDAAFYNPSIFTQLSSISCASGHEIRAVTKYYKSDNTTRMLYSYGVWKSSGTSTAYLPAGGFMAGHEFRER